MKTIPGQPLLLQVCCSLSSPVHSLPPNNACCVIDLFLPCVPPPQVTEQVSHALHWPHVQCTVKFLSQGLNQYWCMYSIPGQPLLLQVCCSPSSPVHSLPPNIACCVIDLFLPWVPPPQVTEHISQALHWPHVQFTEKFGSYQRLYIMVWIMT